MDKPVPQPRPPIYNFAACRAYIEKKLGYPIRDTLGRFGVDYHPEREYRDWWHFLVACRQINNPCEVSIDSGLLEAGNEWENEITQAFIDEFGDGTDYYVAW